MRGVQGFGDRPPFQCKVAAESFGIRTIWYTYPFVEKPLGMKSATLLGGNCFRSSADPQRIPINFCGDPNAVTWAGEINYQVSIIMFVRNLAMLQRLLLFRSYMRSTYKPCMSTRQENHDVRADSSIPRDTSAVATIIQ